MAQCNEPSRTVIDLFVLRYCRWPVTPPGYAYLCRLSIGRLDQRPSPAVTPTPPDREPQTGPQEISTGPVTAVRFASINVEIRTELEKRVLYAL
jgi:hypothetical protein